MAKMTIGPPLSDQTDESFYDYVKALRKQQASTASKTVPDVAILFGSKTQVRIKRPVKQVTEAELVLLAAEYEKSIAELTELLTKRKIRIVNDQGEQTNARAKKPKSGRPAGSGKRKKASQAYANDNACPGPNGGGDQFEQPGSDSDLPPESSL